MPSGSACNSRWLFAFDPGTSIGVPGSYNHFCWHREELIFQDIYETESMIKILRESVYSENDAITMSDIGNTLEIVVAKISNIKYSLDKYIDKAFNRK